MRPSWAGEIEGTAWRIAIAAASLAVDRIGSAQRPDGRPRVVGRENRAKALACARASDRSPLAHPDSMPVAATAQSEPGEMSVPLLRRIDGKIRAVEDLATDTAEHRPDVVAA